jgi:hypothetical protein
MDSVGYKCGRQHPLASINALVFGAGWPCHEWGIVHNMGNDTNHQAAA